MPVCLPRLLKPQLCKRLAEPPFTWVENIGVRPTVHPAPVNRDVRLYHARRAERPARPSRLEKVESLRARCLGPGSCFNRRWGRWSERNHTTRITTPCQQHKEPERGFQGAALAGASILGTAPSLTSMLRLRCPCSIAHHHRRHLAVRCPLRAKNPSRLPYARRGPSDFEASHRAHAHYRP